MSNEIVAGENGQERPTKHASCAARLTLITCSTLLALAAVELTLRVQFASTPQVGLETLGRQRRFVQPRGEVRLGDLVRPSAHPGVVYELIPEISTTFKGKSLHVNKLGFRGPSHARVKPENVVRILGLGDSVMFGWGVEQHETYLALLAERLNTRHPNTNWQVVNTAVPGYNTSMEAAVLRSRGLAFSPDLVIVGYVPNDLDLPNFLMKARDPWSPSECFLADRLFRDLQPNRLVINRNLHDVVFDSETHLDLVPEQYRYMVGEEGYRAAMSQMDDARKEHGFELLVFSYIGRPKHHQRILKILNQLAIPFVSGDADTRRFMKRHGIRRWPGSRLVISAEDPHPSALWHDLLADTILDQLESSGVAKRMVARVGHGNRRSRNHRSR
jgi:hypothetical protein